MTADINEIMALIDCGNSPDEQELGLRLAQTITSIEFFVQPMNLKYNKFVWENCAKVLAKKSDIQLEPYIIPLLEWLQDINWPGALTIYKRLKEMPADKIIHQFLYVVMRATEQSDEQWLNYLAGFIENKDIYQKLSNDNKKSLSEHYAEFWNN